MWAGTLALVLILAGPAIANAEIARDPSDTPGPLDLVRVKVGQKDTQLQARISVSRPLPQLTQLRDHPNFESQKPERFLCLNFASHSIGRRFLCPAGKIKHGRIGVGVSVVGKRSIRGKGSVVGQARALEAWAAARLQPRRARDQAGQAQLRRHEQLVRAGMRTPGLTPGKRDLHRSGTGAGQRDDEDQSRPARRLHRLPVPHRVQGADEAQVGRTHLRRRTEPLHRRRPADPRPQPRPRDLLPDRGAGAGLRVARAQDPRPRKRARPTTRCTTARAPGSPTCTRSTN